MKENYKEWEQWQYEFHNDKKWYAIWTSNWYSTIRINWQSSHFYTRAERKYIFESIQDTINLQLNDKTFKI